MFITYIDSIRPPQNQADRDCAWLLSVENHGHYNLRTGETFLLLVDRFNPSKSRVISCK